MSWSARVWHRAFLEERPSASLGLFRLAVAFTIGAHVLPSLLQLEDNYLSTAFKTQNPWFFPEPILRLMAASPDALVWIMAEVFVLTLASFVVGYRTQLAAILMTLSCYYFYSLNNFHIGTLSFDILLVTLFLVCVTPYPGDFLSLDSLRWADAAAHRRLRPFFLQRLLQLQLVWTFWGTALSKITADGNWLTDRPYYYLMHYPAIGVVREFPLRGWLSQHADLCYGLGVAVVIIELLLPIGWFVPRTRAISIAVGILFQIMLWVTLHVPTIFLFLFPPMMLLFVAPERIVAWIDARRQTHEAEGRHGLLLYDGRCGFCLESVKRLRVLDLFGWAHLRDFHTEGNLSLLHPGLTPERCRSEMVLIEPDGRLTGGFDAFQRLCVRLPLLWPLVPAVFLPGARWVGRSAYRWIAAHRYLFHRNPTCTTNQCAL